MPYARPKKINRQPTHPGSLLKEEVIPALGTTVTQAAADLGVSRMTLHSVLSERRAVSPEMAIRLGAWTGTSAQSWLNMQNAHDLWTLERKMTDQVKGIPERAA